MRKFIVSAAIMATALAFAVPAGATIINLSGVTNASTDGSNAYNLHLDAGTYDVTFVQGDYTAFKRWNVNNSGCDASGKHCVQGWENSAVISIGATTFRFGDHDALGGYGPLPEGGYFATASESLTHAAIYSQRFSLLAPADVGFWIYDDIVTDNHGGVSLSVVAVPEPATLPLLLGGIGLLGLLAIRRRKPMPA